MITFQQILNGDSGLSARSKINSVLTALVSGEEGINASWILLRALQDSLGTLAGKEEDDIALLQENIEGANNYTDKAVGKLYTYIDAMSGGVGGLVDSTSYDPSDLPTDKSITLIALGAGTFTNLKDVTDTPITISNANSVTVFYRAANISYWNYKSMVISAPAMDQVPTSGNTDHVVSSDGIYKDGLKKLAQVGYYPTTISDGSVVVLVADAPDYVLTKGGCVRLKMLSAGTTASTLKIGNADAKELWYNGSAVSSDNTWEANEIISVFYDGTRFMASNSQGSGGVNALLIDICEHIGTLINTSMSGTADIRTRGVINTDGSIRTLPGGNCWVFEYSVSEKELYMLINPSTEGYTSLPYVITDGTNIIELGSPKIAPNTKGESCFIKIPANATKLFVLINRNSNFPKVYFYRVEVNDQINKIIEDISDITNTDIELEHGDGTSIVNFTKRIDILPKNVVNFYCLQFSTNEKAIIFYDESGTELSFVKQSSGGGSSEWISGVAPDNTAYVLLRYRENTYASSYGQTAARIINSFESVTDAIVDIREELRHEIPSYSKYITLEHGDGTSVVNFTKDILVYEGNEVYLKSLQVSTANKAIIFFDKNDNELSAIYNINSSGQMMWQHGTAPKGTSYAKLKYRENTYASSYGTTESYYLVDLQDVNKKLLEVSNSNSENNIVFNGDSTGQGLDGSINIEIFNYEIGIKRGSVGSENVLATAARQGSIPLFILPFTIPTNSIARWTNSNNSIVAEGNDPQVIYSSSLLYHTEYDAQGMPETPSVSPYTTLHFAPAAGFYCNIGGVDGYLYSLPHYHVENGQVVIDSEGFPDMYFHRLEAGNQVVIDKVTEVIPSNAKDWRDSYQVNLMGTNQGFQTYKNQDYILLGNNFNALINAMEGSTTEEKRTLAFKEAAYNLFDIQKRMSRNAKDYLVVGFFCEVSTSIFHKTFYEEYENLCDKYFGNHFFNARLYLKDQAWKDLGITLTNADRANIAIGLPPWSLFNADGQPSANPHLTTDANKALANQVALRIFELGWVENYPNLYDLSQL